MCVFKDLQGVPTGTRSQKCHGAYAHCMALNAAGLSSLWLSWFSLSLAVPEIAHLVLIDTGVIHFSVFATCMFCSFLLISPSLSLLFPFSHLPLHLLGSQAGQQVIGE